MTEYIKEPYTWPNDIFRWLDGLWKWRRNSAQNASNPLECFRISKRTAQLTKCCIKCLEKARQQTKCKHRRQRSQWNDCGGGGICEHNRRRSRCKDCGGSQICEHNERRSQCKDCGRGEICEHNKIKSRCPTYNPLGHLAGVVRGPVYIVLKNDKEMSSTEHLRCNIERFKEYIEQQFTEGMSCHITNHHLKRLLNSYTTQIHSLCGQVKICQRRYISSWSKWWVLRKWASNKKEW